MFRAATSFDLPINSWNVGKVSNMNYMFGAESLSYDEDRLTISFNQPLDGWNVQQVTGMYAMFYYAENFNQ
eukprot:CAMPEP_0171017972 /NCGR_PEP_ID=MMETSP0736-20130129/27868_1 /TAXON_ID=186038 /ORGANISM="Fragilariopsis kerguelensis, Strain L26-C5" /LENGTH=70 /DNA_ID=CAMNT_0011454145 /DNA_START=1 /DNA_END=210 /DNA_ORIENTATION=+